MSFSVSKPLNYGTAGRLYKLSATNVQNLWTLVVIGRMCFQERALHSTRRVHTKADIYCSRHNVNTKGPVRSGWGSFMVIAGPQPSTVTNTLQTYVS